MYKIEINNNIKDNYDFDFSPELKEAAENIIIPLLEEGIATNTDINGGRFPSLEKSTILSKGHSRPLIDTGVLSRSFVSVSRGKSERQVVIDDSRASGGAGNNEIAFNLQIKGVGHKKKTFLFFGLTKGMVLDIYKLFENKLKEYLNG